MMNSNLGDLDAAENYYGYKNTSDSYEYEEEFTPFGVVIWRPITLITCCFGLAGNGCVIWLLLFQIKRNCFTPFILNLAVADFGFLASIVIYFIQEFVDYPGSILNTIWSSFSHIMYINTHFLMTAISIDRCVAVLFPIWHHCSRPKHLSPAVCAFLWIFSFLLFVIADIMELTEVVVYHSLFAHCFLGAAIICLPLITLSTVVLFIKVCLKLNQRNQGRLLLTILITLLCFLILTFPFCVLVVIYSFSNSARFDNQLENWGTWSILFSCLNSSINPVIYFLVGRKKGARSKESMKVILQKVFREGEATGGS
ncbi:mas-related G-protein coupled receptor member H-like [Pituophis catenifer annectens]|uniref:mas-related G-protein coupled receptor member H-like n=1 Tax=Pituophis catenifer annectens TaxID=94852 RepID=UPI0039953E77